jgi:tetratricopeptide (TPR) repeat protein
MCGQNRKATSLLFVAFALLFLSHVTPVAAQENTEPQATPELFHHDAAWRSIQEHLPDPATATPKALETQADILRARRFLEDALTYYKYALDRGGDRAPLLNKIGLTHMQMGHVLIAKSYFEQLVRINRKNAEGWNNLGAVEYSDRDYLDAIKHYKKGLKFQPHSAIFHSNLGLAYLGRRDYIRARAELGTAMKLDPEIFQDKGTAGISAHFLSSADHGRFCYEMARTYAQTGNEAEMLHWLAKASEAGVDVMREMTKDSLLTKYREDSRVVEIVRVANSLTGEVTPPSPAVGTARVIPPLSPANQ